MKKDTRRAQNVVVEVDVDMDAFLDAMKQHHFITGDRLRALIRSRFWKQRHEPDRR
jgi:hypothetical protein